MKDLRIEEPAPPKENKPPQVPDDPAILGVRRSYTCFVVISLSAVCLLRGRSDMMKHFGCKQILTTESANRVDISVAFLLISLYTSKL